MRKRAEAMELDFEDEVELDASLLKDIEECYEGGFGYDPEFELEELEGLDEDLDPRTEDAGFDAGRALKEYEKERRRSKKTKTIGEHNKELGRIGEEVAAVFLDRHGYEIIERNWTCCAGEADIIARDEDYVVFVEVKTRSNCNRGMPSEAVDERKRDRYERIAMLYLRDSDVVDVPVRFDIVAIVVLGPDKVMIRHHIDAFGV